MKIKLINSLGNEERRLKLEGGDEGNPPRVIIDRDKAYLLNRRDDPQGYQVYGVVSAVLLDTLTGE